MDRPTPNMRIRSFAAVLRAESCFSYCKFLLHLIARMQHINAIFSLALLFAVVSFVDKCKWKCFASEWIGFTALVINTPRLKISLVTFLFFMSALGKSKS